MSNKNGQEKKSSILKKSLFAGVIAGLLFGSLSTLGYYLSFSEVSHASFIVRSYFTEPWTQDFIAELVSLGVVAIISLLPAVIYYFTMRNLHGIFPGVFMGALLWVLFFVLLPPFFSAVPSIQNMNSDTIATTFCQFILYGTFIGFTITYESHGERVQSSKHSQNEVDV
ncbi:hypothetical protein CEY16_04240 [Halalkalibacillus sediminis]|uniref:DUF1440 domain-containing protein n=1 Tax=Halalkalibacillus sediminis TaxID=2018042 RepID=A0A2I0QXA6_9BACI|nr:YqhR family membrane protein [Halalkalibacillus sediminis]PKR78971.1 hypothetical protein CEY16_04240 [Halalkalibacillus sediminis]